MLLCFVETSECSSGFALKDKEGIEFLLMEECCEEVCDDGVEVVSSEDGGFFEASLVCRS